jgi:hypothetical protein
MVMLSRSKWHLFYFICTSRSLVQSFNTNLTSKLPTQSYTKLYSCGSTTILHIHVVYGNNFICHQRCYASESTFQLYANSMRIKTIVGLFLCLEDSCIERKHGCVQVPELTASAVVKAVSHSVHSSETCIYLPVD